ncbi:hypothetical protein PT974_07111 [Cladobotryum mycophilum]|uniref:Uncharacterized protein n=1 Tax=Cladobotryum mycophilum TaxID=491253 RepID=A0ABR0SPG8_9HYPO
MGSTPAPTPTTIPDHDGTAPAGALTTIFTPPASCLDKSRFYRTSTCEPLPERWRLYWSAASYYSPGICPSGMLSVATPPPFFGPPVQPSETAIVCCPTGYSLYASSDDHWCYGSTTLTDYNLVDVTTTITSQSTVVTTKTYSRSYFTTSSLNSIFPIQVRWRDVDLSILETHPLTPGLKPTGGGGGGGGSGKGSGGSGGSHKDGLSGGAIAGIVVGSVLVVLLVAGIGLPWFLLRRGRNKKAQQEQNQSPQDMNETGFQGPPQQAAPTTPRSPAPPSHPHQVNASDNMSARGGFVSTGDANIDAELRRIAERRNRLMELDEEEARLRQQANRTELSTGEVFHRPVELGTGQDD